MSLNETVLFFLIESITLLCLYIFNWEFTLLCQFPLYSKMNQLCGHTQPLFFGFPSHWGRHRALSRAPCYPARSQRLSASRAPLTVRAWPPPTPVHPTALPSLAIHTFVLCVCVAVSALKKDHLYRLSRLHIGALIRLCLTDFTPLVSRSIRFSANDTTAFLSVAGSCCVCLHGRAIALTPDRTQCPGLTSHTSSFSPHCFSTIRERQITS